MTYDELDLGEYYNSLLGQIESRTSIFAYGTSGSGKSVWVLQFANFFAETIGKSIYASHEEALKKSMRDRAINFKLEASKLYIGSDLSFEELLDKIKRNYYRMAIIDSVQFMNFTYEQQKILFASFPKRKIIFVFVSFGTGYKKPKCSTDIMHACDIKLFFDAGKLTIDSRYKSETLQVELFKPQTKKQGDARQLSLL